MRFQKHIEPGTKGFASKAGVERSLGLGKLIKATGSKEQEVAEETERALGYLLLCCLCCLLFGNFAVDHFKTLGAALPFSHSRAGGRSIAGSSVDSRLRGNDLKFPSNIPL